MPVHIHQGNTIHDFTSHSIITKTWSGTTTFALYQVGDHGGASIIAKISNGTDVGRYIIEIGSNGTDIGHDVTEIALTANLPDLTFTTSVQSNIAVLTIANVHTSDTNTMKYYSIISDL